MTRRLFAAAAWLACATALPAQTPPAGAPPLGPPTAAPGPAAAPVPPAVAPAPAVTAEVWQHLVNWERVMKAATSFVNSEGTKTVKIEAGPRKGVRQYDIDIMCKMPGKARMSVKAVPAPGERANPSDYEAYITNPTTILEYSGLDKRLTETRFPPGTTMKGMLLLDVLSGEMTARGAVDRFAITLEKQDADYIYLKLVPKLVQDQEDFESMILILFRDMPGRPAYLPRQAVMRRQNNQVEETWSFNNPAINLPGVKDEYFNLTPVDKATWRHVIQNGRPPRGNAAPPAGVPAAAIPGQGARAVVPTPGAVPPK